MRFVSRAFIGLSLLIVSISMLAYGGYRLQQSFVSRDGGKTDQSRERSFSVDVQIADPTTEISELEFFGEIRAWRSLEVRAARGGEITALAPVFRDGAQIVKGELLYSIESGIAENSVASSGLLLSQSRADLQESESARELTLSEVQTAERQLEISQSELERQRNLFGKGLVSQSAVEQAELALASARQSLSAKNQAMLTARMRVDTAKLAVDRASLDVDDARLGLDDSNLYAPFDGVLADVSVNLGGRVAANEKLALLIDPKSIEVSFRVRDSLFARLLNDDGTALAELNVRVSLNLGLTEAKITGVLDRISALVDSSRGGRQVFVRLDASDQSLIRPGDIVSVTVEEAPVEEVVKLTVRSVLEGSEVYVVNAEQRIETQAVEIVRQTGDAVLVRGLAAGAEIVLNPLPQLGPGVKVRRNGSSAPDGERGNKPAKPVTSTERSAEQSGDEELIEIDAPRRDRLIAAVEANRRIPVERRAFIVDKLSRNQVPRQMVERIESRLDTK